METSQKLRLPYLDVAKGLLMIMVIFSHICWASTLSGIDVGCNWQLLNRIGEYLWVSFYMPCFFIITGYCTSFDKPFKDFLYNSITTLLWPMLVITFDNHWFIYALFIGRLIVYGLNKYVKSCWIILIIVLLMSIAGSLCTSVNNLISHNRWYIFHAFGLTSFIYFGFLFKKTNLFQKKRIFFLSTLIYLSIVGFAYNYNFNLPSIFSKYNVPIKLLPLHLILSVTGSLMLIGISKCLKKNMFIEYIGKNSLIIFFVHVMIITAISPLFAEYANTVWAFFSILLFTLCMSLIVAYCFNIRFLSWLVGKVK